MRGSNPSEDALVAANKAFYRDLGGVWEISIYTVAPHTISHHATCRENAASKQSAERKPALKFPSTFASVSGSPPMVCGITVYMKIRHNTLTFREKALCARPKTSSEGSGCLVRTENDAGKFQRGDVEKMFGGADKRISVYTFSDAYKPSRLGL